jgi:hypothetical protein
MSTLKLSTLKLSTLTSITKRNWQKINREHETFDGQKVSSKGQGKHSIKR